MTLAHPTQGYSHVRHPKPVYSVKDTTAMVVSHIRNSGQVWLAWAFRYVSVDVEEWINYLNIDI